MNDLMSAPVTGRPVEEGMKLIEIRMKRLKEAYDQLLQAGRRNSIIATILRIMIIVLGALVGIQGTVEQQMKTISEVRLGQVVMVFTIIGFIIATLAALEQAFKFEQKGAALNALAQKAQSQVSYFMRLDADPERNTYKGYWELAKEQDEAFDGLSPSVTS
jgi:hypothetical protein